MHELRQARSHELDASFLRALRVMLDAAFDGDFSDQDWAHTTGGVHVWLGEGHLIVSHASIVERTLHCAGRKLRAGYVEAVATVAASRRQGHGSTVMRRGNELVRAGDDVGALSTGTPGFYESLGWERWRGPTFVNGPNGLEHTVDDDDSIMILRTPRTPELDIEAEIVCEWRPGDVW